MKKYSFIKKESVRIRNNFSILVIQDKLFYKDVIRVRVRQTEKTYANRYILFLKYYSKEELAELSKYYYIKEEL